MHNETAAHGVNLVPMIVLLLSAVVTIPVFRRLGLDSVLGYLAAGLVIGPFGLGLFNDPETIISIAELGIVLFLFVIGLEMQPARLWNLRREILGLGLTQLVVCTLLATALGMAIGYAPVVAFILGAGFALTSTAIVMQVLGERGEIAQPAGQRIISILLLEDLAIVPLLALVAFLAPGHEAAALDTMLLDIGLAAGALLALILAGRYLLDPVFNIIGRTGAREVMTATALLVVLGAAWLLERVGLSMAMGAFLAGVILSDSAFRHQLEADVQPFRDLLLGLFFLGIGMALNLGVIADNLGLIALAVVAFMAVKGVAVYAVARLLNTDRDEAFRRATLMAQGGEFAFVLFATAGGLGLIDETMTAVFTATVILSMAITPLVTLAARLMPPGSRQPVDDADHPRNLASQVLVIGFGRFGQMVSQVLMVRGFDVAIIDTDVQMIQVASGFGFKVWYGDGCRLDILQAAGAARAQMVMVCVDDPEASRHIAEVMREAYPQVSVMARAYDRVASLALINAGVVWQIRETLESAFLFGREGLRRLGLREEEAEAAVNEIRDRDTRRLEAQIIGGIDGGRQFFRPPRPRPEPLSTPREDRSASATEND